MPGAVRSGRHGAPGRGGRAAIVKTAALALGVTAAGSGAWGETQAEVLARRLADFASMPGLSARFVEERYLTVLREPLVNRGEVFFAPPDRLLWRVDEPAPSVLLVDGESLAWAIGGEVRRADLASQPGARALVDGFRLLLRGDLDALRELYAVSIQEEGEAWSVRLEPLQSELAPLVRWMEIGGSGRTPERLRVVDARGDETRTRFVEVRPDRRFDESELARLFRLPGS